VDIVAAEKLWREFAEPLKKFHIPVEVLRLDDRFDCVLDWCLEDIADIVIRKEREMELDLNDLAEMFTFGDALRGFCRRGIVKAEIVESAGQPSGLKSFFRKLVDYYVPYTAYVLFVITPFVALVQACGILIAIIIAAVAVPLFVLWNIFSNSVTRKQVERSFAGREAIPLSEQLAALAGEVDVVAAEKFWREFAEPLKEFDVPAEALRLDDRFHWEFHWCIEEIYDFFKEKAQGLKLDINFAKICTFADMLRTFCGRGVADAKSADASP